MIINNFDPQGHEFKFHFTEDTCYEMKTGVCALEAFKDDLNISFDKYCKKKNYNRCVRAYLSLKADRVMYEGDRYNQLVKHKCGHFEFGDGQHRTCVALKMNMLINVEIYENENDDRCQICKNKTTLIKEVL